MNDLVFSKLTRDQILRFPVIQGVRIDPICLLSEEPDIANVLNLLTCREASEEDLSRAAAIFKGLSDAARVAAISSFVKHMRDKPNFGERFKQVNSSIMPLVVQVFNPKHYDSRAPDLINQRRSWHPHQGASSLRKDAYFSSRVLMTTGRKTPVLNPGSSFRLCSGTEIEHGAVDAVVDNAVHGELKVIFFPNEVREIW